MQPLPCYKSLWEARTTREWKLSWAKCLAERRTGRTLVIEDLMTADDPRDKTDIAAVDGGVKFDVVRWCENLDGLGTLMYMVLPLERKRHEGSLEIGDYL